ncbi:LOW QUALITY PROTEIN: hypothetical protein HID58_014697, partial [Brassica napus]
TMSGKKKQKKMFTSSAMTPSPLPSQYEFVPRTQAPPPVPNRQPPPSVSDYPPPAQLFQDSTVQSRRDSTPSPQPRGSQTSQPRGLHSLEGLGPHSLERLRLHTLERLRLPYLKDLRLQRLDNHNRHNLRALLKLRTHRLQKIQKMKNFLITHSLQRPDGCCQCSSIPARQGALNYPFSLLGAWNHLAAHSAEQGKQLKELSRVDKFLTATNPQYVEYVAANKSDD